MGRRGAKRSRCPLPVRFPLRWLEAQTDIGVPDPFELGVEDPGEDQEAPGSDPVGEAVSVRDQEVVDQVGADHVESIPA